MDCISDGMALLLVFFFSFESDHVWVVLCLQDVCWGIKEWGVMVSATIKPRIYKCARGTDLSTLQYVWEFCIYVYTYIHMYVSLHTM